MSERSRSDNTPGTQSDGGSGPLAVCDNRSCGGNGWWRRLHDAPPVECAACGDYATIRQIQYLVRRGYVVCLNLATCRVDVQRRIGAGTDGHIDSFGSVLAAIAHLVLGVDLPEGPAAITAEHGESETVPPRNGTESVDTSGRPTANARPSSTPPATQRYATYQPERS